MTAPRYVSDAEREDFARHLSAGLVKVVGPHELAEAHATIAALLEGIDAPMFPEYGDTPATRLKALRALAAQVRGSK